MLLNVSKLLHRIHKAPILIPKINPTMMRSITDNKPATKPIRDNWTEIYRLPLIRLAAGFNRLKIYQTLVTAIGTPMMYSLESAGYADPGYASIFTVIGITGILTLTLCSLPIRNLIGFIYINDNEDKIRIAYVDFWGKRRDTEMQIDEIIPPWDLPARKVNLYHPVTTQENESKCYKLLHRFGTVKDPERYINIFGEESK